MSGCVSRVVNRHVRGCTKNVSKDPHERVACITSHATEQHHSPSVRHRLLQKQHFRHLQTAAEKVQNPGGEDVFGCAWVQRECFEDDAAGY